MWDHHISTLGSGSDYTAFQDFAGIASLSMGFGNTGKDAVYHYHSNYDSLDWMDKFGDPGFEHHASMAKIWGLIAANLVETPVLQLNATDYAISLHKYVESVKDKAKEAKFGSEDGTLDSLFSPLDKAVSHLRFASKLHDSVAAYLLQKFYDNDIPWWKWWEKIRLYYAIRSVNTKYKLLERQFLYADGLDERSWFKHVVFAPGRWTGYAGATFPGIVEAIEDNNKAAARRWVGIITGLVENAASFLTPEGI